MNTSINNIFRRILNESFDDDYADFLAKKDSYDRANKRVNKGRDSIKNIIGRRSAFEVSGHKISLASTPFDDVDIISDGKKIGEINGREPKKLDKLVSAICMSIGGFDVGNMSVWSIRSSDEIEEFDRNWNFFKEVLPKAEASLEKYLGTDLSAAMNKRYDDSANAYDAYSDARDKAAMSFRDETPDYEEGGYAVWNSKNGKRKVTVVSVDEPNQRAKINTAAGATMYVPLSSLEKVVDYNSKGLGYNDYSDN